MASDGSGRTPRAQPARCRPAIRRITVRADRRVRLPLGLRDDRAGRPVRQRRVALPTPARLAQRLRRDPRSRRGRLPLRPVRHPRPGRASLPAGDDGPRDELGLADRLDDRARRAPDRPVAAYRGALADAASPADRLRRQPCPAAHGALRERRDAADARLRAGLRLRPPSRHVELHRGRLPPGRVPIGRQRRRARAHERHEHRLRGHRAVGRTLIKEGEQRFCALAWNGAAAPRTTEDAYQRLVWTAHHWQHWLARGTFPDHPWRSHLERSALTLKGLTYAPSGAVVAAPTTSLPETPGGERNWDYRYSWIRDSTFALWGLYTLGFDWEANDYLHFIADVAERDESSRSCTASTASARCRSGSSTT